MPGIVGEDDRRIVEEADQFRWNAIGRLNRGGLGFCTAVLIGPSTIVTAAHCLWDTRRDRWLVPDELHFVPGYRRGAFAGHAQGRSITTSKGLEADDTGRPTRLSDDWAVIELDTDLLDTASIEPIPLAGHSAFASNSDDATLTRIGYGTDRPHLAMIVDDCRALGTAEQGRVLIHDCDAVRGDSGSPLIVQTENGLRVLAIQSAFVRRGDKIFGIGVLLTHQVPTTVLQDMIAPAE